MSENNDGTHILESKKKSGFWDDKTNRIKFAKELGIKYNWKTAEDWNQLAQKHFKESSGDGLLKSKYHGSPWQFILDIVVQHIYPDFFFCEWKIGSQSPNGFWKNPENVRFCLDVIANYEGFTKLDDFYNVSQDTFKKHRIVSIQNKFGSHLAMLKFAYPEKSWKEWRFHPVARNYWDSRENRLIAIKDVENELGINEPSEWYKHTGNTIDKYCGTGLLANKYECSLIKLLQDIYPEFPWKPYRLTKAPHKYWINDDNCREFINDYMNECSYSSIEDLYNIRYEKLIDFPGARGIIDRFGGSYIRLFIYLYPQLDAVLFFKTGVSKIANEYLVSLEKKLGPLEREFRISKTRWKADGYHSKTNTIYEFLGDYWHGNPNIYASNDLNPSTQITFGEMYKSTMERLDAIRSCGFNVVYIWESEYKKSSVI
jgi:hypothetical protein